MPVILHLKGYMPVILHLKGYMQFPRGKGGAKFEICRRNPLNEAPPWHKS